MQFISLGPLTLNIYPLLIAMVALGSLGSAWWQMRDARVFPAALVVTITVLAFARLGYIALNWDYFREHGSELLSLTGLSEHGAIIGGMIGYRLLAKRVPFPPFSILNSQFSISAAASLACIPNGCAYGREVFWQTDGAASLAWLLRADWPDAFGMNAPRWPTQALLAAWLAATTLFIVVIVWERERTGSRTRSPAHPLSPSPPHLFTLSFAAADFALQFLRGDPALMFVGLRIYQWFDLGLIVGCLVSMAAQLRRKV